MTIVECLKKEIGVRLSISNKWLVWNEILKAWMVYQESPRKTIIVCTTDDEETAVSALVKEN